jgi:hypothetical protein
MAAQFADPGVSQRKFEREIRDYAKFASKYRERGWFLIEANFPRVSVILAAAKLRPAALVMGVEFDYSNYDALPPSVRIVNPFTGEPYRTKELPTALNRSLPPQEIPVPAIPGIPGAQRMMVQGVQSYLQSYGPEEIPFLCLAGVREYHEHPAHSGDLWELHRTSGAGKLVRLLEIIHRYGIEPITGFSVQFMPKVGLELGQAPS